MIIMQTDGAFYVFSRVCAEDSVALAHVVREMSDAQLRMPIVTFQDFSRQDALKHDDADGIEYARGKMGAEVAARAELVARYGGRVLQLFLHRADVAELRRFLTEEAFYVAPDYRDAETGEVPERFRPTL